MTGGDACLIAWQVQLFHFPKAALAHCHMSWPARNTLRRLCAGSLKRYSRQLKRTLQYGLDNQAVFYELIEFYTLKIVTFSRY